MKKILSLILTVAMIMSAMTVTVANVSATVTHGEYTSIDLPSGCKTSKAFLSESTAGTITNAAYPDFFMGSGVGKAYAISKESIDAMIKDGVLTAHGIPFKMNVLDNEKCAMGSTGTKVAIPTGYYSKIHVLTVGSPDYTGDNTIYRGMLSPDVSGETGMNLISSQYVADLAWAKVTASDDFTGKNNPKLMVETFEITDKTKRFNQISFWLQGSSSKRILAVTTEGLKGADWNPIIATKIAALPEASAYTEAKYYDFEEVEKLINLAKAGGADISQIQGIAKYNQIKAKIQVLTDSCVPIDLTPHFNAVGYVSEAKAGQVTTEEAKYPHYFVNSGGTAASPMAISSEAVKELAPNGIATLKGVPYYLSAPADGKNGVIKAASQVIDVPNGYYSSVRILAVYNPTGGGDNTFYNNYYTVSGGEVSASKTESQAGIIKRARVLSTDAEPSDIKLIEFKYEFKDKTKEIDSVKIWQQSETQIRVLAVTMEGVTGTDLIPSIESKIAALSSNASEVTKEKIDEVTVLLAKAQKGGADVKTISGYAKYNKLLADKYNCYKPINVSSHFNAKGYLSQAAAGTIPESEAVYPHYFRNSGGSATSPMAISSEAVKEIAPEGLATLNNVPYYLSAAADGQNGMIKPASQVIDIPDDYYSGVILLGVYNPTGGGDNTFYNNYYTVSGGEVGATKTEGSSAKIKRARVLSTDAEPADVSLINFNYDFNDKTQKMASVKIWQQSESVIRVLAVTMMTLKGNEWNPIVEAEIAALPEDASTVDVVKFNELTAMIEKAEKSGAVREVITGMDKYERIKAELEALDGVADFEVSYDNDDITIDVTFETEVEVSNITKENIVLTCGREAIDYTVSATENGAKVSFKNEMTTKDSYQFSINIDGKCKFETIFTVSKPITAENVLLKNSSGNIIDRVSEVTDGKVTFTAEVKNNTYKSGKVLKIVNAVYNDGKLYAAKIAPAYIAFEGTYLLNDTITVPTEGLNEKWSTATFIWSDDLITPLVKKNAKTYGIDALNDLSKDITVAFIGGSITEGNNYTDPFVEKWQADRTGKITMINAGIGGTTSSYGTMRLYEDVLSKNPDIVFVEFTLNDTWLSETQTKKNVESMIRQCYERDHQPVISFIIIPDRRTNTDGSYQIAEKAGYYTTAMGYYGLTPFNAHQMMVDAIAGGSYTWDSFVSAGNVHPDRAQGENIATVMYNNFKANYSDYVKNIAWKVEKGFNADSYSQPAIISSAKASYDSSWENSKIDGVVTEGYGVPTSLPFESFMASGTNGAKMTFKFSGTKILISSLMGHQGKGATYTITNDNGEIEKSGSISTYIADYSWYENIILTVEGLEDTNHTLTITVSDGSGLFGLGEFWIDE